MQLPKASGPLQVAPARGEDIRKDPRARQLQRQKRDERSRDVLFKSSRTYSEGRISANLFQAQTPGTLVSDGRQGFITAISSKLDEADRSEPVARMAYEAASIRSTCRVSVLPL